MSTPTAVPTRTNYWPLIVITGLISSCMCIALVGGAYWFGTTQVVAEKTTAPVVVEESKPTEKPVCEAVESTVQPKTSPDPTPEPILAPTEGKPLIDQFDQEQAFPARIEGPALAEVWSQTTGYCAVVSVNQGEILDWSGSGAYWAAWSQDALDVRFLHHSKEYLQNYPNCKVLDSADGVPNSPKSQP